MNEPKEIFMKTIIKTFLAVAAAVAVSACDGDRYDLQEMTTEPYHKVLGFQDAQYENIHLYNASEPVTLSFKVLKGGSDPQASCSMKVSAIPQEELSGYGQAYIAVPKSYYTVDGAFDFQPGEPSKDVSVTFSAEGIAKMKSYCEEVTAAGSPSTALEKRDCQGCRSGQENLCQFTQVTKRGRVKIRPALFSW